MAQLSSSVDGTLSKFERDAAGFPVLPPGQPGFRMWFGPDGLSYWTARQQPISRLAEALSNPNAGREVLNKTGLTGKYDKYQMRLADVRAADDTPTLILEDALEQQLGLKLMNAKGPFDFVLIDNGDKVPIDN